MKNILILGLCSILIFNFITHVESSCTANCDEDCNNFDCSTGCKTNCQSPCRRRCNKNPDCGSKCDVKEVDEPEVQKIKETVFVPPRDSGGKNNNSNDIRNDYNVDINPNITLTNSITNMNNISVPINITSINMNNIRVSSSDARSTQTNITARGGGDCSGTRPPSSCNRNERRIIILPYPQYHAPQIVSSTPQSKYEVQPIIRQPIIVQVPSPPPQKYPVMFPTPVIQPNLAPPVQSHSTVAQPIPQYYWFSQQYLRPPQQTVITQPQQQIVYQAPSLPCGAPGGQCGQYCINQPCSQGSQVPKNYPVPSTSCQTGGCSSKMMYTLTAPWVAPSQPYQYGGINPYLSGSGFTQYDAASTFASRDELARIAATSRNGLPHLMNANNGFMGQIPFGVDSYFIPDQFSRYQVKGVNSTEAQKNPLI